MQTPPSPPQGTPSKDSPWKSRRVGLFALLGVVSFVGFYFYFAKNGGICTSPWMCQEKCREGYQNKGGFCYKSCGDKSKDAGFALCREGCPEGFKDQLGVCVETKSCPAGYRDDPLTCHRDLKCETKWDPCKKRWPKLLGGKCMGLLVTRCNKGTHTILKETQIPKTTTKDSYLPKTELMPLMKAGILTTGVLTGSVILLLLALTGKVVVGLARSPKTT